MPSTSTPTVDIDANGILNVSATDKATGKEQHIRIEASSGLSDSEIQRMRDEAKANEAADKAEKERVDKINSADALTFQAEKFLKDKRGKEKYNASIVQEKPNVWRVEIPNEKVGQIVHSNGVSRATLDGSRMQMYSNEIHGQTKILKKRQKLDYQYKYSEIFKLADEDNDLPDIARHLMTMNHWEYNSGKGRDIEIYYIYTVEHGFVDAAAFKARSKELNKGYVGNMQLEELLEYVHQHHIPELPEPLLENIRNLKKKN